MFVLESAMCFSDLQAKGKEKIAVVYLSWTCKDLVSRPLEIL